ncbi:diacylglycerol kinase family protein [Petrotoga sp. 9PWA.NaAc.5.4]|uniref:diacylglycerol kinase family protein n=1 Tax=Petrotoga sp. 9PWA.NaAc.5.4 TaxID=1434328 RepID=UPI000CB355CD|nr:diacylglycerol kinase family protein [Petrotoga sp. 9PWA.NaAc.5.4]PNR96975.1 undecaprenol kinase [Petrotoga sp. 9PWA.NaAc.5.4]
MNNNRTNYKSENNLKSLKNSFNYAFKGIFEIYKTQRNFRIQSLVGLIVMIVAFFANLTEIEFIFIILSVFLVLIMESINTVFEKLLDFLHPFYSSSVKLIKDISAAAVLITSIFAVAIGITIFGRAFFNLPPKYGIIIAGIFLLVLNIVGAIKKPSDKNL